MRILIRCDASPSIGVGHVLRSLALAEEAIASGHEVTFAGDYEDALVQNLLESSGAAVRRHARGRATSDDLTELIGEVQPEIVHLDTYDSVHIQPTGLMRPVVSNIEDGAFGRRRADLVIDPNFGSEKELRDAERPVLLLRGSRYTPLREVVTARRGEWRLREAGTRVLIVMGGTDPQGLTSSVLEVLSRTGLRLHVTAIVRKENRVGAGAVEPRQLDVELVEPVEDLPALAVKQDLVVSAAGTSAWELCCLGVPIALVCAVENQRAGYERVIDANAAVGLGSTLRGEAAEVAVTELKRTLEHPATRRALSGEALKVVDGLGAWRIVRAWEQSVQTPSLQTPATPLDTGLSIRRVTIDDAETLLQWRNDPLTRENSRNHSEVAMGDHMAWVKGSVDSSKRLLLVAADNGGDVGTVRWDLITPGVWEVSVTVAPERRGHGAARALLSAGERFLREAVHRLVAVEATVHEANAPSHRLFTSLGYILDQPADREGFVRFRKPTEASAR